MEKKEDVGIDKRFSKKYGNKGMIFQLLAIRIKLIQALDTKRPVARLAKGDC